MARSQQRGVARQDEDVTVRVADLVADRGQRHRHGVTGAQLFGLLDEAQAGVGASSLLERVLDPHRTVADDDHGGANVLVDRGVEHVHHHRAPTEVVQRLWTRRTHPGSLARGEHDDTGGTSHLSIIGPHLLRCKV